MPKYLFKLSMNAQTTKTANRHVNYVQYVLCLKHVPAKLPFILYQSRQTCGVELVLA